MTVKNLANFVWLLSSAGAAVCLAQTDGGPATGSPRPPMVTPTPRDGIALSQASAFVFYSSQPLLLNSLSSDIKYGSVQGAGGTASVTWNHTGARGSMSAGYTGSYFASSQAVDLTSFNHSLVFDVGRPLGRWTIGFSLNGQISGPQQYLFNPSSLEQIAATPSTTDEFTSALLTGNSTNGPLNNLFNRAPTLETPLRGSLYGNRTANVGTFLYAHYATSPRFSIRLSAAALKNVHLPSNTPSASSGQDYLLTQSTFGTASVGVSYSLSPRTQLGSNLSFNWTLLKIQPGGDFASGNVFLGRIMGRRWFIDAHAGAGTVFQFGDTVTIRRRRVAQPIVGGSMAFRTAAQTWMFVEDWAVGDVYGAGSASTLSSSFTWGWSRPGSGWSVVIGASHQQLQRGAGVNLTGEGINANLSRTITRQTSIRAEYGFQTNSSNLSSLHLRQQGVRLSLAWSPGR